MEYAILKVLHQITVALSIGGFVARGIGIGFKASWPSSRLAKTLPHINDTVLLVSALALAWILRVSPTNSPWLLVKIIGLLVYIALGVVAIRPGRALWIRFIAWLAALCVFAFIVSVAITKTATGFLSLLL